MAPRVLQAWRLIAEVDFEGVRREAERPFQVLVAAEDRADAERLARLLPANPTLGCKPARLPRPFGRWARARWTWRWPSRAAPS